MKTDIFKMEKNAIFKASLKLIKEGKFQATPLTEIAFLAKLSGSMIHYVFESREKLVAELSENLTGEIEKTMEEAGKKSNNPKKLFFESWMALYKYYTKNPDVIAFIEQFENFQVSASMSPINHPANSKPLVDLFKSENMLKTVNRHNAETLAYIFHGNALNAAKMNTGTRLGSFSFKAEQLPALLWNGIHFPVTETNDVVL